MRVLALAAVGVLVTTGVSAATAGTPVLVKDINPGPNGSFPGWFVDLEDKLYFSADDGLHGDELWKSDGTEAGTALVKDVAGGPGGSEPTELTRMGDAVFFDSWTGGYGREISRSDGTEAGTVLLKDIYVGSESSNAWPYDYQLTTIGATLYFRADDGAHGVELWKSDGTEAGTVLIKDIAPGRAWSEPILEPVEETLFLAARDGAHGRELWKSDGTETGTVLVKDVYPGARASDLMWLTDVSSTLFFSARDGRDGQELWRSDGTEAGTRLVKDIDPAGDSNPEQLTAVGPMLFFTARDDQHGPELWKSDGTREGTVLVKDIYPGPVGSSVEYFTAIGGEVFFRAFDDIHGFELWKTDGTEAGTVLVKDINPGPNPNNSFPGDLTNVDGVLFFAADDGSHGSELWQSDGTEAGTMLVADIDPGAESSYPGPFDYIAGTLYFTAFVDGVHGTELWKLNASAPVVAHPSAVVVTVGTLRGGGPADLAVDDDNYLAVDSTTGTIRKTAWYGVIPKIPNELTSLKVTYKGKNSSSCTQVVGIRNWVTKTYTNLDKRLVGPTEVELADLVPPGPLGDYVSGQSGPGQVRLRVQCSRRTSAFTAFGDLMQIIYTSP